MSTMTAHQAANNILLFLRDSMWTDIEGQLAVEMGNEANVAGIIDYAKDIARKFWDKENLLGVATYSTAEVLRECNLVNNQYVGDEIGKQAIKILKDSGRIKQVGPGKGKAIILIEDCPLPEVDLESFEGTEPSEELPEATNFDEISKAILTPVNIDEFFEDPSPLEYIDEGEEPTELEDSIEDITEGIYESTQGSVVDLLREATDEYRNLKSALDQVTKTLQVSKETIQGLHREIEKKNEVINERDQFIDELKGAVVTLNNRLEEKELESSLNTWS